MENQIVEQMILNYFLDDRECSGKPERVVLPDRFNVAAPHWIWGVAHWETTHPRLGVTVLICIFLLWMHVLGYELILEGD